MQPQFTINLIAVMAAVVVSFIFGWLWHGPLLGKKWASLMNRSMDHKPTTGFMMRSMGLTLLGTFLLAYVLAHAVVIWRPSVWGWGVGSDAASYTYGFLAGFFVWLGYFVPQQLAAVAWEGRSWQLFSINAGYHFVNLQIIAMMLAYWR